MAMRTVRPARGRQPVEAERRVYWHELGRIEPTRVLRGSGEMSVGTVTGPVLVELPDTVVVVRPGQTLHQDAQGNLLLDIPARTGRHP